MHRLLVAAIVGFTFLPLSAHADISGLAHVLNGDTLTIAGKQIGLYGVDAPERDQQCLRDGKVWPCGAAAAEALRKIVDQRPLWCREISHDYLKRRSLAICFLGDPTDRVEVNAKMVESGMAVAYRRYSRRYVNLEKSAKAADRGLWAGDFVLPWKWRRGARIDSAQEAKVGGTPPSAAGTIATQ